MSLLPTKKELAGYSLLTLRMLLYGPPGIGKSTFASKFEDALFIATEQGRNSLNVYPADIDSWDEWLKVEKELLNTKHRFKMLVFDTADNLFRHCQDYVAKKHGFSHPSDEKYGRGWDLLKTEFTQSMLRLSSRKQFGLLFTSHTDEKEIIRNGTVKTTKIIPTLSGSARKVIEPFVDIIGLCGYKQIKVADGEYREKRVIYFSPSEYSDAKDRTGLLPEMTLLNYSDFAEYFEED